MNITAYHVGLGLITFSMITGCVAADDGSFGDEDTAESAEALGGNPDPCAMGTDPNFTTAQLTAVGASESYVRAYQWIDGICPDIGQDRATTIVDFPVPVPPTTRIKPLLVMMISFKIDGTPSSSMDWISTLIFRITMPTDPRWRNALTRNRASFG